MIEIVGRGPEIKLIRKLEASGKSEFLALFGRRRIGKTFLIRSLYQENFSFYITGMANVSMQQQLINFNLTLRRQDPQTEWEAPVNWQFAFQQLISFTEKSKNSRKIIFIDELPWFDTMHSDFIPALEHFWNSWASARSDIFLIVCGSATSWMINTLINNKGGLHNRVTQRIRLEPFTMFECSQFLQKKDVQLDHYQIVQIYMVMGGVPYYWDTVEKGKSATQIIEQECFTANGLLRTEFDNLFRSLFQKSERHVNIVKAVSTKAKGLTRDEISTLSGISNGGGLTRLLTELEECDFITRYVPFGKKSRESLYQLSDMYSLFYLKFIQNTSLKDQDNWLNTIDSPRNRAWSGYAFEQVCMSHAPQIKKALGISGVETKISSWRSRSDGNGAQIDLVIDRRDQVINLCEMKFSINKFIITKQYAEELRNKIAFFKNDTKTRKSIFLTMITTFGVENNTYYGGLVHNDLTMDMLFSE